MGSRGRWVALVATLIAIVTWVPPTPAQAGYDPPPSGSNDFTCRPTAAKPNPVVLVHGLGATQGANWGYMAPRLKAAGYCVFSLTYGVDPRTVLLPYSPGGVVAMERSAPELKRFVDRVLTATGAREVDLIGHSEGTVMPRVYLKELGGAAKVERFLALTPLWRGTKLLGIDTLRDLGDQFGLAKPLIDLVSAFCGSCPQFLRGSPFLNRMNAGGEGVAGVSYTSIMSRYDELVIPFTSGVLNHPGATNIVVQDVCPGNLSEHGAVAFDPVVLQLFLNALDPANARPVAC